jgi:gliding motility-associated-like protein
MCAIKANNGKIWTVLSKAESDQFIAFELKSMSFKISILSYSREFKSLVSSSVFHPSAKLIFYSTLSGGGQYEYLDKKSTCLNFNPESGEIGFRGSVQYPAENQHAPTFDSTGNLVYIYTFQPATYLENMYQIKLHDWLKSDFTNMHLCMSRENLMNSTLRFIHATNGKIYFNVGKVGYGIIHGPEKVWPDCNIQIVNVKNRNNAFYGWQESVPEQKKVPIDTFTFFNATYPLNTIVGIPNAFTPNGDLLNDAFFLTFNSQLIIHDFKVRIFSRWGVEVFKSDDPYFYWDGTFKDKQVPEGVYYYFINLVNKTTGKTEEHKGPLVLMR